MIKLVEFLERDPDLTHEEFVEYWLDEHADLAAELPGLKGYRTSVPTDPESAPYDGVLEFYFEDQAALGAAFESETGEAVLADAAEFCAPGAGPRMIVEEHVHVDELD